MRHLCSWILLSIALLSTIGAYLWRPQVTLAAAASEPVDDRACAGCHRAIYERYEQTSMARGSGVAVDGLLTGGFRHATSGVDYKVFLRDGEGWMSYHRAADAEHPWALDGARKLRYFIGSGHRGRTYLYEEEGLWFEAPINYYSKKAIWDMAPNYGASRSMPDGLPVDPNCLHCHASELQPSLASARNRYVDAPFRQGGIGCAACHGDAREHVATQGRAAVLNPATLTPARRDSVCLQCHLEGDAAIYKAGKSLAAFRPGEDLGDYVNYFVRVGAEGGGGRAASQYEALLRSRCKIASGDKMTCTTCHDPHGTPTEAERVSFYRGKCLSCHGGAKMAMEHHPEQQDCAVCHMPTRTTTDISHEQTTDHDIRKRPGADVGRPVGASPYRLVAVGMVKAGDRETGLAYAQAAEGGNREALEQALTYLHRAEVGGADDEMMHSQMGLLEQLAGDPVKASDEYEKAIAEGAMDNTALANDAVLKAATGKADAAIRILRRVVENDPSQVSSGLNLAFIECVVGQKEAARGVVTEMLRFSPDDPALLMFEHRGMYGGRRCSLHDDAASK
jgi:Flp pilus assembly protein TadD